MSNKQYPIPWVVRKFGSPLAYRAGEWAGNKIGSWWYRQPVRTENRIRRLEKRMVNIRPELKHHRFALDWTAMTSTLSGDRISVYVVGTGETERVGARTKTKQLQIRLVVKKDDASAETLQLARVIVLYMDGYTANPQNYVLYANNNIVSGKLVNSEHPYRTIYDETFAIDDGNQAFTRTITRRFKKPVKTEFGSANWVGGQFFVLFMSDQVANQPLIKYYSQLRFTDN